MRRNLYVLILAAGVSVPLNAVSAPVPGKDIFWHQNVDESGETASEQETSSTLSGNVELGLVMARGNSDTETLQAKAGVKHDGEHWRQKFQIEAIRVSDGGATTTDRYQLNGQSDRKMSSGAYAFLAVSHEVDKFSGFDYQSALFAGYGRDLVQSTSWQLSAEIGPGYRYSEPVAGDPEKETLLHIAGKSRYQFNEQVSMEANMAHDRGNTQVITQANVSLVSRLNAALAMKIHWGFRHNDSPPAGVKKVDVLTSVTIAYDF